MRSARSAWRTLPRAQVLSAVIATGELRDNLSLEGSVGWFAGRGPRSGRPFRRQRLHLRAIETLFLSHAVHSRGKSLALDWSRREQHLPVDGCGPDADRRRRRRPGARRRGGAGPRRRSAGAAPRHPLASGSRAWRPGADRPLAGRRGAQCRSRRVSGRRIDPRRKHDPDRAAHPRPRSRSFLFPGRRDRRRLLRRSGAKRAAPS